MSYITISFLKLMVIPLTQFGGRNGLNTTSTTMKENCNYGNFLQIITLSRPKIKN